MSSNYITSEGAKCIAEAIQVNTTLHKLDLSNNAISDDGVDVICGGLKNNTTLQELNISHNHITNKGTVMMAEALQTNSVLQNINISKNYISIEGLQYFIEVVKNNCTLHVVNITHNNVTRSQFTIIKQCTASIQHSTTIYASWNEINKYGKLVSKVFTSCAPDNVEENIWSFRKYDPDHLVMCLSECLKEDDTLQELNLSYKVITCKGAEYIAEAIQVNTTLHTLDLYQCNSYDALSFNRTILNAVHNNNSIIKLRLPYVYGDDERLVSSEVEKIKKREQDKVSVH